MAQACSVWAVPNVKCNLCVRGPGMPELTRSDFDGHVGLLQVCLVHDSSTHSRVRQNVCCHSTDVDQCLFGRVGPLSTLLRLKD